MSMMDRLNSFRADWIDVGLIKIGVFVATILLVKLWNPIISFKWYWFLIILIVVSIRPMETFYKSLISK